MIPVLLEIDADGKKVMLMAGSVPSIEMDGKSFVVVNQLIIGEHPMLSGNEIILQPGQRLTIIISDNADQPVIWEGVKTS